MQMRTLGQTGLEVSVLSYGASSLGGVFHDIREAEGIRAVHESLDAAMRRWSEDPSTITKIQIQTGEAE